MKDQSTRRFYTGLCSKTPHFPITGMFELTYRCSLNCIHCCCKGSEDRGKELSTAEVKKIMDEIQQAGCIWLCPTGGDPLIREDFLELYTYAKQKGFLINIFTNGQLFTKEIFDYLVKYPPFSVEITLNGITKQTYESITQVKGSFEKVVENIKKLKENKIPLILKTNCLKQNKHEVDKIKRWVEELLGIPEKKIYHFRYDPIINPRFNSDVTPCNYRLSIDELLEVRKQDMDIWEEYKNALHQDSPDFSRDKSFLYRCNAWMTLFFITPFGRLKFCPFYEKFSMDLKTNSFKQGFYEKIPQLLNEKFKTDSKCQDCALRPACPNCPARAFLETGDEEAPVKYYCELAKATMKLIENYQQSTIKV